MIIAKPKNIMRVALVTILLLCLPLVAMQFSDDVVWTLGDFIVAGVLLFGAGTLYEVLGSKNPNFRFRIAVAVLAMLVLIWVSLAVGPIGS